MKTLIMLILTLYVFCCNSCMHRSNIQTKSIEIIYIYHNSKNDFLLGKDICYYALADSLDEIINSEVIREEDYITQKMMIDDKNLEIVQDSSIRYYLYNNQTFRIKRILIDSLLSDFFNFDDRVLSWDLGTNIYKKDKYVLMRSSDLRWCGLANQYKFIQFFDLENMQCYEFFVNYYSCIMSTIKN